MRRYAQDTQVPVERSRLQIENLVRDHGADQFMFGYDTKTGLVQMMFRLRDRMVKLRVPLPPRKDYPYETGYERACRQRWRALLLVIKAKFEAIESGISTFEHEFLADVVMADGTTLHDWMAPQLKAMYADGKMPKLLPGLAPHEATK